LPYHSFPADFFTMKIDNKPILEHLSALQVQGIFLMLFDWFTRSRISIEDFSAFCNELLAYTREDGGRKPDTLWAELEDIVDGAADLSWYKRTHNETSYDYYMKQITDYIENLGSDVVGSGGSREVFKGHAV